MGNHVVQWQEPCTTRNYDAVQVHYKALADQRAMAPAMWPEDPRR